MDFKALIDEIESNENKARKAEHLKRNRVYNDYQRDYVLEMLTREFSKATVSDMRTVTSINLCRRIIDEMASIYKRKPERSFGFDNESSIHESIEKIYQDAKIDTHLKRANQKFKLHHQCCIQVIPKDGKIQLRVLAPHQYDVVPMPENPEQAYAYIISSYDKSFADAEIRGNADIQGNYYGSQNNQPSDGINQKIADEDDYKVQKIYIVWTAREIIKLNEKGILLESNPNPIGILPFIDIASEKDFEFWVRKGSDVTSFALDFSTVLSDVCNISRLQSYAQPVIVAEKLPELVKVGPQYILHLPLDPTRPEVRPQFEFANPNPDLKAALELQDKLISYFLTAQGISPKTISGTADSQKYTSGLERLLAMIERFEASQTDIDLFIDVENSLYSIIRAWYNAIYNTDLLDNKYKFGQWDESAECSVKFLGPEIVQTEADKEDSIIKLLDAGLISKEEAIAELRGISIEEAKKVSSSIDSNNNMEA